MHILFLTSWYKSKEDPIYASFVEDQARMLQDYDIKVGVLHINWNGSFLKGINKKRSIDFENDKGITTFHLNISSIVPRLNWINFNWIQKNVNRVFNLYVKENGKPNLIHAHSVYMGGIAAKNLYNLYNIPYILTEHTLHKNYLDKTNQYYIPKILNSAKKVIYVSRFQRDEINRLYKLNNNNSVIIPNTLNKIFTQSPLIEKHSNKPFRFIFIGWFIPLKSPLLIIKAFAELKKTRPDIALDMAGAGPLLEECKELVKAHEIPSVHFYGAIKHKEICSILDKGHALISASTCETFGISIIESLARGKPVICSDSGGPRDFVIPQVGELLKIDDVKTLVDAMDRMIENYDKYNLNYISKYSLEKFSPDIIARKVIDTYNFD